MADISSITQGAEWQQNISAEGAFKAAESSIFAVEALREKQRHYIAAYTDRQPGDITADELDNCQDFWNRTPQAMADVLAAGIDGVIPKVESAQEQDGNAALASAIDQMLKHWLLSDTVKYLDFNGADLKAAYLQYDADGQELIRQALAQADYIISRRYVKAAVLPTMEQGFLEVLSDSTKRHFGVAIRLNREPNVDTSTFWLFCLLFDMADDDRRGAMAQAIGTEKAEIEMFISRHDLPARIIFKAEPTKQAVKPKEETQETQKPVRQIKADTNIIRQMAQYNSNNKYDVSIDDSVYCIIGKRFNEWHTDGKGFVDFYIKKLNSDFDNFSCFLDATDILISIAWESLRATGGYYITPLDIWHKICWGVTNKDSTHSQLEKKMIKELKENRGPLYKIVQRVERQMHLETIYRKYSIAKKQHNKKEDSEKEIRNPKDLVAEFRGVIIPLSPRAKIPGYRNYISWAVTPKKFYCEYDEFSTLPYMMAVANKRLMNVPAEQIDLRNLGISNTLHFAELRDVILRMVLNAQSHEGIFYKPDVDKVYDYGRLDAHKKEELEKAQTPEELRTIKNRQRMRKSTDAETIKRIIEGFKQTNFFNNEDKDNSNDKILHTTLILKPEKKKGTGKARKK